MTKLSTLLLLFWCQFLFLSTNLTILLPLIFIIPLYTHFSIELNCSFNWHLHWSWYYKYNYQKLFNFGRGLISGPWFWTLLLIYPFSLMLALFPKHDHFVRGCYGIYDALSFWHHYEPRLTCIGSESFALASTILVNEIIHFVKMDLILMIASFLSFSVFISLLNIV